MKDFINPLLSELLTKWEYETIRRIYKAKLEKEGVNSNVMELFLKAHYENLKEIRAGDIPVVLKDIEDKLPRGIANKLIEAFCITKNQAEKGEQIIEAFNNPLLKDFVTREEFELIKSAYKRMIDKPGSGLFSGFYKRLLESHYSELDKMRVQDISVVLNEIEGKLPRNLFNKMLKKWELAP